WPCRRPAQSCSPGCPNRPAPLPPPAGGRAAPAPAPAPPSGRARARAGPPPPPPCAPPPPGRARAPSGRAPRAPRTPARVRTRARGAACSTGLELHRGERDRRSAAAATPAALRRPAPVETTLARWAAVSTAQQVLALLDGREVTCESATVETTAWDAVPRRERWQPHPRCECRKIRPAEGEPVPVGSANDVDTATPAAAKEAARARTS